MQKAINRVSLQIATVNGSGSQSANNILLRAIFRMGIPVSGKNLFPSNIAGLPTWFIIRASEEGFSSIETLSDIVVALNSQTVDADLARVKSGGIFIYGSNLKLTAQRSDVRLLPVDFVTIAGQVSDSIKLKKLLTNMVYVGILAELLGIPEQILSSTVIHQFEDKKKVIDLNISAVNVGREYCRTHDQFKSPEVTRWGLEARDKNKGKILIDGNAAGALGAIYGGCSFTAWYPITPSSSVVDNFEKYCQILRKGPNGENNYAVIQAEDELSAICMVAGAGWSGARSMTATSGPGISLMAEATGLMYFAEIPGVIWNVQRAGPSTGLPTRTLQSDILTCATLSHGDTQHPLLIPANPKECFEMAQAAFDLAERIQGPVFVMSDLDLGMNSWVCDNFDYPTKPFDRGKVLNAQDLEKVAEFKRYADLDKDGIPYRTLPGTENDKAGYFTRGTGHDESAKYTEDPTVFKNLLDRFKTKWKTIRTLMPKPIVDIQSSDVGIIAYGSTDAAISEVRHHLKQKGMATSYMRLRAFPFSDEVTDFIAKHKTLYVVEQNSDGQMRRLLIQDYPEYATRFKSVLSYDGWPVRSETLLQGFVDGTV